MSELILHIGAHKTATTTLQKALSQSKSLLRRANIIYPQIAWFQYAQHRLAFSLKNITDPARGDLPDPITEIAALNNTLARNPGQRVLISSEELFTLRPDALELLRDNLVAPKIRIIACVRRPDEMLLSIYNQKVKTPTNKFAFMLRHFLERPRAIDADLSYGIQLGKWMDCFGDDKMTVFTYEEGKPVDVFFGLLGLDAPVLKDPDENRSVPAQVCEIMRIAKATEFDKSLQQKLFNLAAVQFEGAPQYSLSYEQRLGILNAFAPEYDAIFARLGRENPYAPSILGAPADEPPPPPPLAMRDMMALIETLMRGQGVRP